MHQALFGVLPGHDVCANHKGMPHPTGDGDFLRKQVLTSRNVPGGPLIDVALGGLNYQIEHHVFPGMPPPNLRRAQPHCRGILCRDRPGLITAAASVAGLTNADILMVTAFITPCLAFGTVNEALGVQPDAEPAATVPE